MLLHILVAFLRLLYCYLIDQTSNVSDSIECSDTILTSSDHSRHLSEEVVKFSWAKILFPCRSLLPTSPSELLFIENHQRQRTPPIHLFSLKWLFLSPNCLISSPIHPPSAADCYVLSYSSPFTGMNANEMVWHPEIVRLPCSFASPLVVQQIRWRTNLALVNVSGLVSMKLCH